MILALAIATAMVQARVTTVEAPVIRDIGRLTAVCCVREQCPFKTACCRNGEVGRIARRGRADQRAIRAVAEVVGIADDIQAVIVVIAAVHPVINIVPPAFNIAILRKAVAVAACRGRTGVITHRIGLTVVHLGIARRAASADALAVPVGKLHEEQHVHIPELSEIHLPEVSAEVTELFPCGLYQRKEDDPLTAMQYHWHDEIEIIYFESGKASIRIGTEIYDLTEEIFFFVNSGEPHMLTWEIPCRESALVLDSRSFCTEQYSNTGLKIGYLIANGNVVLPRMLRQGSQCFEKIKQQYKDIVSEFVELGYSDLSTGQILIKDKGAQNIIYGSYIKILG